MRVRVAKWIGWIGVFLLLPISKSFAYSVELTAAEEAFVRAHPRVTMCVNPAWPPFEWLDRLGEHRGIAADLAQLAARRVGLTLDVVRTDSWTESLAAAKAGRCEVLNFLNQTRERDGWLLFTEPLFTDPNVFITREEHAFISDPAALKGETIVFPIRTALVEELVRRDYPNLSVVRVETEEEAITMVSARHADMTLRSLMMAAYTIRQEGLFNLKIAGQLPGYSNHMRFGVLKSLPLLRAVLDKGVRTITSYEVGEVANRHVAIKVEDSLNYPLIFEAGACVFLLFGFGAYYLFKLRRLNRELERVSQVDVLTGLANRGKIDTHLAREMDRVRRYGHGFSVLMLDIDRFKAVNDEFGHLMGDRVLVEVARRVQATVRGGDVCGRWGGEEFLVLYPETANDEAFRVAERIREAMAATAFPDGRGHTVSAGVATFAAGDTVDGLLQRADAALYRAKAEGRDRACRG